MRILVVEDDEKIADFIRRGLEESAYVVKVAYNGDEAFAQASADAYDAIILDMILPGRSGLLVVRDLRDRGSNVPILALTARSELAERIQGLNTGCDDYLAKPFAFAELLARLRALLRGKAPGVRSQSLVFADLSLDPATRLVIRDGRRIELTFREFALLELLLKHSGRVVPSSIIMERVWGEDAEVGRNVLEVTMHSLRRKVEQDADRRLLHTVRGMGYMLRAEN